MNPDNRKNMANNVIAGIRKIDKSRTLIAGASNYNSIYELSRTTPLSDRNVIYAFHFYEPFFFIHKGAEWVGNQVATIGVLFPYDGAHFPPLNPKARELPARRITICTSAMGTNNQLKQAADNKRLGN